MTRIREEEEECNSDDRHLSCLLSLFFVCSLSFAFHHGAFVANKRVQMYSSCLVFVISTRCGRRSFRTRRMESRQDAGYCCAIRVCLTSLSRYLESAVDSDGGNWGADSHWCRKIFFWLSCLSEILCVKWDVKSCPLSHCMQDHRCFRYKFTAF